MITANMVFNMRLLQDLICDFINSFSIFFTIVSVRRVSHPFIICLIETTRSGAYMNIRFSRSHKPSLFMIVFENSGLSDMTNKTKNANAITVYVNLSDLSCYLFSYRISPFVKCINESIPIGRKYTHQTTSASLPPTPSPPDDIFANIPVIGINVQLK